MNADRAVDQCSCLALQFRLESLLALGDVLLVAIGIDECVMVAGLPALVFLLHSEIPAVRAEKDVAGERFQHLELVAIVARDLRVGGVANQFVAGIHIGAADDHDVERLPALFLIEGPGGGALRMAGRLVGSENGSAQRNRVPIVEHAVHARGRETTGLCCWRN